MKNAIATDKAPMRGVFSMRVKDRAGNIVEEYVDHNMIVNGAKLVMAKLVSDPAMYSDLFIRNIVFGDGDGTATPDQDSIDGNSWDKPLDVDSEGKWYEYPEGTADRVQFNWSLDYNEFNGHDIKQFGLLCNDGTLFAKKTRRAIYKDDTLSFEGTWTIIF